SRRARPKGSHGAQTRWLRYAYQTGGVTELNARRGPHIADREHYYVGSWSSGNSDGCPLAFRPVRMGHRRRHPRHRHAALRHLDLDYRADGLGGVRPPARLAPRNAAEKGWDALGGRVPRPTVQRSSAD